MKSLKIKKVRPASDVQRQFMAACWRGGTFEGFRFFSENCLKVRAPFGGTWRYVPLVLNEEQETFARAFIAKRLEGKKARFIVLKARKLGLSTLIQALGMWYGAFTEGWKTKTIAHQMSSTVEIGAISVNMSAKLPEGVKDYIAPEFRNGKLVWASGSEITVETQKSENQARGGTPSLLHMSEVAFWDENRKDGSAEGTMTALFGALEEEDGGASTAVVIETTANGVGGTFHTRWIAAQRPESEWVPFFFPWQNAQKHQLQDGSASDAELSSILRDPLVSRDAKIRQVLDAGLGPSVDLEWAQRAADFALSVAQLRWAIGKTEEMGSIQKFDQEYPMSAELAFISSGRLVLDTMTLKKVVASVMAPAMKGGHLVGVPQPAMSDAPLKWADVDAASGVGESWWWWRLPERTWRGRYSVGVDPSMGSGKDRACISVKDLMLNEQVAEFYCEHTTPDVLAAQAMMVGHMYGDAILVIEINGPGNVVVNDVLKAGYPAVYRRAIIESNLGGEMSWVRQFGVYMDERNRTMIVDGLVRGLKEGTSLVRSHRALEEFRTFRFDAKGKPDHEKGKHSDAIMAAGHAEYGRGQAGDMEQVDSVTGTPLREVPSLRDLRERWNSGVGRADPYFGNRR